MRLQSKAFLTACAAALVAVSAVPAAAQTMGEPEEFTAFAIATGLRTTGAGQVIMSVRRWTTQAESEKLVAALKKGGPDGLLEAMRDMPRAGTIRTPDSLGYDLRYAVQLPLEEGGRRIILATDRSIGFWEATARPRSIEYPFTVIELRMKADGTGEGGMSIASRIDAAGSVILIENYDSQPVKLNEVKSRKLNR